MISMAVGGRAHLDTESRNAHPWSPATGRAPIGWAPSASHCRECKSGSSIHENGEGMPAGKTGMLWVNGSIVFPGYLG